jgi:hypothetical protein
MMTLSCVSNALIHSDFADDPNMDRVWSASWTSAGSLAIPFMKQSATLSGNFVV